MSNVIKPSGIQPAHMEAFNSAKHYAEMNDVDLVEQLSKVVSTEGIADPSIWELIKEAAIRIQRNFDTTDRGLGIGGYYRESYSETAPSILGSADRSETTTKEHEDLSSNELAEKILREVESNTLVLPFDFCALITTAACRLMSCDDQSAAPGSTPKNEDAFYDAFMSQEDLIDLGDLRATYANRPPYELPGGSLWTEALADFLGQYTVQYTTLSPADFKITTNFLNLLLIIEMRLRYLDRKARITEEFFNSSSMSVLDYEATVHHHLRYRSLIDKTLPGFHLVHGTEPLPYSQVGTKRFINLDWVTWSKKVNGDDQGDARYLEQACNRAIELLFPSKESRKDIGWELNGSTSPKDTQGGVLLPMELSIYRTTKEYV